MTSFFWKRSTKSQEHVDEFVKIYDLFRDYIKSEDALIKCRMTWMLTIHGFLYATFGFTLQKLGEINEKIAATFARNICSKDFAQSYFLDSPLQPVVYEIIIFLFCICIVGSVISITAWSSVSAAYDAATSVRVLFERYRGSTEQAGHFAYTISGSKSFGLPLLTGGGAKRETESRGYRAAWSIPTVLLFGWAISSISLGYMLYKEHQYFSVAPRGACGAAFPGEKSELRGSGRFILPI